MIIRNAIHPDVEAIVAIHRLARSTAMPWLPILHTEAGVLRYFARVLLPEQNVRVAEIGSNVVGYIVYKDDWVDHLYIHPDHWRKGIGATLLSDAKLSSPKLQLWAFQENHTARAFYKAADFTEVELTDGQNNEEKTPDVRMEWSASMI